MKGRFTVGSVSALPTGKLVASISRTSKSALGPLDALWTGPYVISVRDRSARDGFRLSGTRRDVPRSTSPGFTGSAKWTVTLGVGKYWFRKRSDSEAPRKLHGLRVGTVVSVVLGRPAQGQQGQRCVLRRKPLSWKRLANVRQDSLAFLRAERRAGFSVASSVGERQRRGLSPRGC